LKTGKTTQAVPPRLLNEKRTSRSVDKVAVPRRAEDQRLGAIIIALLPHSSCAPQGRDGN
jgi:hypothetical protein